ncbi:ROK family protein [Streptomyces sp. NPDC046465]|uniref:ROK family protein n=1 Tax=Streptomyces sp. NPDC046465 TaxID=3155810 RepID=UPI0033DD16F6
MGHSGTGHLGIDVGGTKVALRIEADGHAPLETAFRWPGPEAGAERDFRTLASNVRTLLSSWGRSPAAVGVAMPATTDSAGRVVAWPGRPGWRGADLRGALRDLFPGIPVQVADDGDLAALAEARVAGRAHLVYLGVGTGIGGGIVREGRPFPGPEAGSCEIGHMAIDYFGPTCDCGRQGCLQAVASGPATLRRAALLRGGPVDFVLLRSAVAEREPWAVAAVEKSCAALAAAAMSLAELARPELVVIGGGFAEGIKGLVSDVAARTTALSRPGHPAPRVAGASLGGLSSLHGAVLLARIG